MIMIMASVSDNRKIYQCDKCNRMEIGALLPKEWVEVDNKPEVSLLISVKQFCRTCSLLK